MDFKSAVYLIIFGIAYLMIVQVGAISQSSIVLDNGGYTNIVVAIDELLEENDRLIPAIKKMFIDGSRYLYQATRKRVYFKNVTILIPSNWTTRPEYGSPGRLTFDMADIRVAQPNPLYAPGPYTHQVQGCGKPGSYIHFIEEFLTNPGYTSFYGPLGKVLVHEWGHLRWGLFNEYPDPVGDQNDIRHFYQSMEDGKYKPVVCSLGIDVTPMTIRSDEGRRRYVECQGDKDIGYEEGCMVTPRGPGSATGSIMTSLLIFEEISNFCDNDENDPGNLHNREAPNKHNRLCESRSAWEVMREHEDFKDNNSPPQELSDVDIMPSFSLTQARSSDDCRIVLVIDTSGSMSTNDRITKAESASTAFIDLATEGTWVGLVGFTDSTDIIHGLIQVNSSTERSSLLDSLNLVASGGTCIGCGLETGLQVLRDHPSGDLAGADILLMTDGEDGGFATHTIRQTLQAEGVRVHTVAIGDDAYGELNTVSLETGGRAFSYGDNDGSASLTTSLSETVRSCKGTQRVELCAIGAALGDGGVKSGHIYIDPSIGSRTQFIVTYTEGSDVTPGVTLTLTRPNNTTISTGSPEYNDDVHRKVINVVIDGKAESGRWFYQIENKYPGTQSVTFSGYSSPNPEEAEEVTVINVKSYTSTSILDQSENVKALVTYAEVTKGSLPVINASIQASVERPGGDIITYDLLDNGAGADVTANDGVYSRSFLDYTGEGYYGVSISAENDGSAMVLVGSRGSPAMPFINITDDGYVVSDTSIGNYTIPLPGDNIFDNLVLEKAAPFTRSSSAGSTNVPTLPQNFTPGQDQFPPNRVHDLRVKLTSLNDSSVVLTWTAPGDDLDTGTAVSYDIRVSHSSALISTNFSDATRVEFHQVLRGNMSSPKPFGSVEEYEIRVEDVPGVTSFSYAFALRASDDAGLTSSVSNVVMATFRRVIPTAPAPPVGPCDGMLCHNGGTLDQSNCSCLCSDQFQGENCQYVKSQLRNGVQIDLLGNTDQWTAIVDPLLESVTQLFNIFCNNNFDVCCQGGRKVASERTKVEFVTRNDIKLADGYPVIKGTTDDGESYLSSFVVYGIKAAGQDICSEASGLLIKWKREVMSNVKRRSIEHTFISKHLLLEAISSGRLAISTHLRNISSRDISIVNITLPVRENTSVPADTKPLGTVAIIVIICSLIFLIVIILLAVAYYYKRKNISDLAAATKAEPEHCGKTGIENANNSTGVPKCSMRMVDVEDQI
ncbi:calcium-activated chloride channel regulator 1-like [Lytechinus variegatus]|uniref:calcium-activated chloride channel regulator 1-like n=1 Tax=Lytechinus variegatus TaxID=7654 RepID=UPI001BB19A8B|nr:calcium-activated chloride channel regulator 1-like [Lytechinus variegatus]